MQLKNKIFKLRGKVQHYAWGGNEFISALTGIANPDHKPCAEYWMGAHPSAPSVIEPDGILLNEAIIASPATTISQKVFDLFGELPYLFKVLDVKDMLSIQVHPTKTEAAKGFDAEEAAGVPINAPHRNYKDRNHKPEVMVALSDEFWLLHGFKQSAAILNILENTNEFNIFVPLYKKEGIQSLYRLMMEMTQSDVNNLLLPLVKREIRQKNDGLLNRSMPGWWVAKLFEDVTEIKDIDRGIFSIYLFNIVKVNKGQAIFQGAGIPHAYLEGQNMELMANSDNVLRGGLTPKHIDVPELMKHTSFQPVIPSIMDGKDIGYGEKRYDCPVPDFGISKIELGTGEVCPGKSSSLEILIATEGGAIIDHHITLKKGEVLGILPDTTYKIESTGHCVLFKAFVP